MEEEGEAQRGKNEKIGVYYEKRIYIFRFLIILLRGIFSIFLFVTAFC